MTLNDYLKAMPKVELHVHLEGSTSPEMLLKLAERNGVKLPVDSIEALQDLYVFRNFEDFLKIYLMITDCLQTPQDFADLVYAFGKDMAQQNIRYAEVTWSPQSHVHYKDISFEALLEAVNDGRARAKDEWGVEMRWIPDIVRNLPEKMDEVAAWIYSDNAKAGGVVALGLGGMEQGFLPALFQKPFEMARQNGMPANPHAGETVGAESVWQALNLLGATRIGHGVRAIEDPNLIKYLAKHQIPLEVCPTSNLCLQIYPSYAEHPLKKLIEAGCIVSINSDDPPLFNTTLTDEYRHAVEDCGLTRSELEKTVLDAIRVSYLTSAEKNALLSEFEAEFKRLHHQYGLD